MPPDSVETRPHAGFRSYADDTPRGREDAPAPQTPPAAGWADTPAWRAPSGGEDKGRRAWPKVAALSGAAMGLVAAAALGWGALREGPPAAEPAAPPSAEAPEGAEMEIVLTEPPPPPPPPKTRERLEVLPAAASAAAPARVPPAPGR